MRESNLVEVIKAAFMACAIPVLLYLAFTISAYGDTVDANGNNLSGGVESNKLCEIKQQNETLTGRVESPERRNISGKIKPPTENAIETNISPTKQSKARSQGASFTGNLAKSAVSRMVTRTTECIQTDCMCDGYVSATIKNYTERSAPSAQNPLGSTGNGGKPNQLVSGVVQLARTPCSSSRDGEQGSGMLPVRIGVAATAQNNPTSSRAGRVEDSVQPPSLMVTDEPKGETQIASLRRAKGCMVSTAGPLTPLMGSAELYARLIDERYIPWTEPAILKGNSFADRMSESQ